MPQRSGLTGTRRRSTLQWHCYWNHDPVKTIGTINSLAGPDDGLSPAEADMVTESPDIQSADDASGIAGRRAIGLAAASGPRRALTRV